MSCCKCLCCMGIEFEVLHAECQSTPAPSLPTLKVDINPAIIIAKSSAVVMIFRRFLPDSRSFGMQ